VDSRAAGARRSGPKRALTAAGRRPTLGVPLSPAIGNLTPGESRRRNATGLRLLRDATLPDATKDPKTAELPNGLVTQPDSAHVREHSSDSATHRFPASPLPTSGVRLGFESASSAGSPSWLPHYPPRT
jgi:hypothetical protein